VPKPADLDPKKLPTAKLLWPTSGHVITQYYGWKHTGVDIDGDYSSPLYAAADGTVQKAGWNSGGYGLMILIDHPNGMTTRYGHASKLFVKAGDSVKKGQVIAMMGTTGRSTGTHLHFEVYVNGKRTNPLAYTQK
jgi:murein DD-endopeptidase MepM/ murein hydrolase activator NlpD